MLMRAETVGLVLSFIVSFIACIIVVKDKKCDTRYLRNELCVIVVLRRVDVVDFIPTEIMQCLHTVTFVNGDKISVCPDLNADQHEVDAYWMIQL